MPGISLPSFLGTPPSTSRPFFVNRVAPTGHDGRQPFRHFTMCASFFLLLSLLLSFPSFPTFSRLAS